MQGSTISRLVFVVSVCGLVLAGALTEAFASEGLHVGSTGRVLCQGMPCTVGLVLDSRGNLYAADRETGCVFCLPPSSHPVLLAKVPGRPSVLAVDRRRTVFVGVESGAIFAVGLDGDVREVWRIAGTFTGLAVDRDGGLVVGTADGRIIKVPRKELRQR